MHGTVQANRALGNCDLMLIVGSRLTDRVIGRILLNAVPNAVC